jgi:hypothetical protein
MHRTEHTLKLKFTTYNNFYFYFIKTGSLKLTVLYAKCIFLQSRDFLIVLILPAALWP